jgi:hypothetical protein
VDKIRDPSKRVRRSHAQYRQWVQFLSTMNAAAHRFNSGRQSARETADYLVAHFDAPARAMLETVGDYSSALVCGKALDDLVLTCLAWFRQWIQVAALPPSKRPSRKAHNDLRKRLMRRAEHWKAEAQARVPLPVESPTQRARRRQRELQPLLKKAGITSDDAWAECAGASMDRNTPRDYRNGKTKTLRRGTRQALAQALGIPASKLPQ